MNHKFRGARREARAATCNARETEAPLCVQFIYPSTITPWDVEWRRHAISVIRSFPRSERNARFLSHPRCVSPAMYFSDFQTKSAFTMISESNLSVKSLWKPVSSFTVVLCALNDDCCCRLPVCKETESTILRNDDFPVLCPVVNC